MFPKQIIVVYLRGPSEKIGFEQKSRIFLYEHVSKHVPKANYRCVPPRAFPKNTSRAKIENFLVNIIFVYLRGPSRGSFSIFFWILCVTANLAPFIFTSIFLQNEFPSISVEFLGARANFPTCSTSCSLAPKENPASKACGKKLISIPIKYSVRFISSV